MVAGLVFDQARTIAEQRLAQGPYADVDELAHSARLPKRSLELLARASALAYISGHLRLAHWGALGVERLSGMLAGRSAREQALPFSPPSEGEDIVSDYRGMRLTLGRHPLALLRRKLDRLKVSRAAELACLRSRARSRCMSLEDETGISNLIARFRVQESQREAVFGAHMMVVQGGLVCNCLGSGIHSDGSARTRILLDPRDEMFAGNKCTVRAGGYVATLRQAPFGSVIQASRGLCVVKVWNARTDNRQITPRGYCR